MPLAGHCGGSTLAILSHDNLTYGGYEVLRRLSVTENAGSCGPLRHPDSVRTVSQTVGSLRAPYVAADRRMGGRAPSAARSGSSKRASNRLGCRAPARSHVTL